MRARQSPSSTPLLIYIDDTNTCKLGGGGTSTYYIIVFSISKVPSMIVNEWEARLLYKSAENSYIFLS